MRTINVGVFNRDLIHQASPCPGDNVFAKGLEGNGHKVHRLDYRASDNPNEVVLDLARDVDPSLFWFGKAERITIGTIKKLRDICPSAVFVKWAADVRHKPISRELAHNALFDWYFPTFGGGWLKNHLVDGMTGVASVVAFTDSDYFRPMDVEGGWKSEVLFTGRTNMRAEVNRVDYLNKVVEEDLPLTWYGQKNWIGHPEYLYAINGAEIGFGINHFVRPLYTSARLANYTACGTFYLSSWFPKIDLVFSDKEIDWFRSPGELVEKIRYYLPKDGLRANMAERARQKTLKYFDAKPLIRNLLYIIENGESQYPWDDVYLND